MNNVEPIYDLLKEQLSFLERAVKNLTYSLKKIRTINLDKELTEDEFEILDSFSSRYLRLYEVLVNGVIRTILSIVGERKFTHLDNMAKAEQLNLITNIQEIEECRKLRNQIAHEYLEHEWVEIYKALIETQDALLQSCQMSLDYANLLFQRLGHDG